MGLTVSKEATRETRTQPAVAAGLGTAAAAVADLALTLLVDGASSEAIAAQKTAPRP